jgi:hypothetical protein
LIQSPACKQAKQARCKLGHVLVCELALRTFGTLCTF